VLNITGGLAPASEFVAEKTEEFARAEHELLERFRRSNQRWSQRLQTEVKLFSELEEKLNAARSIPEATAAYQSYASQHLALASEDARHLFEDCQAFAETSAHLWAPSWPVRRGATT
jgi:histidinol dehydrogenase